MHSKTLIGEIYGLDIELYETLRLILVFCAIMNHGWSWGFIGKVIDRLSLDMILKSVLVLVLVLPDDLF